MENAPVPFGFIKDDKIYLKGWSSYPDKEIGEIRDGDLEKSVAYFVEKYKELSKKVEDVIQKIDSHDNKGSFLMKLLHLKELLPQHEGLGDYADLAEKVDRYESLIGDIIQKNRERNTEIKSALIKEAEETVEVTNWRDGTEKVNDLKARWIKTGNAEEDKNETLEQEFWKIIQGFFERKKNFYEDKQKLLVFRKKQYEDLVDEASKVNELSGKERFDKVKELREQWKEVGGVPSDVFKPLVQQFNGHLKSGKGVSRMDYSGILESLQQVKSGKASYNKSELDQLKKNIRGDRVRDPAKGQILELIQLLTERDFIQTLANKRFKDFARLEVGKRRSITKGILNDLIARDRDDLKVYEENATNFKSADGKMSKMVADKLSSQQRKISVKEKLLEWIENDEF